jgi:hypothetical protein
MSDQKLQKVNPAILRSLDDDYVEIIDSEGNKIRLKKTEAALLSDGLKITNEHRIILG